MAYLASKVSYYGPECETSFKAGWQAARDNQDFPKIDSGIMEKICKPKVITAVYGLTDNRLHGLYANREPAGLGEKRRYAIIDQDHLVIHRMTLVAIDKAVRDGRTFDALKLIAMAEGRK